MTLAARRLTLISLCVAAGFSGTWAHGDQTDPRLQDWFGQLKSTEGFANQAVQQLIWSAWYAVPEGADQLDFDAALGQLATGQLEAALLGFEGLAQDFPDFAEVHNQTAIVHFALGQDQESTQAIYRTLALEPRHFGAWAGLAQILLRNQDYTAAIEAAQAALAINPQMTAMEQLQAFARRELEKESA